MFDLDEAISGSNAWLLAVNGHVDGCNQLQWWRVLECCCGDIARCQQEEWIMSRGWWMGDLLFQQEHLYSSEDIHWILSSAIFLISILWATILPNHGSLVKSTITQDDVRRTQASVISKHQVKLFYKKAAFSKHANTAWWINITTAYMFSSMHDDYERHWTKSYNVDATARIIMVSRTRGIWLYNNALRDAFLSKGMNGNDLSRMSPQGWHVDQMTQYQHFNSKCEHVNLTGMYSIDEWHFLDDVQGWQVLKDVESRWNVGKATLVFSFNWRTKPGLISHHL